MQRRAALIQRRLALATAATATAYYVGRHFDRQRRPLQGCSAPTAAAALSPLQASGVGVVENLVPDGLIRAVKSTALYASMPIADSPRQTQKTARQERFESRKQQGQQPPSEWRLSSLGRYHRREETWEDADLKVIERVEQLSWPLVVAFFDADEETPGMQGIYRSEMQMLNAVPGSANQTWHSDNRKRGLSIIIPLVDFTADNGGTQVLVGSHRQSWSVVAQQGAQVVQAPVGSVAAYDSRTYHRGLGNLTAEGRPALIFCYDRTWSPPPGSTSAGSLAHANLAGLLNVLSAGWIACSSLWRA